MHQLTGYWCDSHYVTGKRACHLLFSAVGRPAGRQRQTLAPPVDLAAARRLQAMPASPQALASAAHLLRYKGPRHPIPLKAMM